jgi:hypothetical protein
MGLHSFSQARRNDDIYPKDSTYRRDFYYDSSGREILEMVFIRAQNFTSTAQNRSKLN